MKKLTLYLNETLIKKAKRLAKDRHTSVSKLISEYIKSEYRSYADPGETDIHPLVRELMGIIPDTGKAYGEIRGEYHDHVRKKGEK